MEIKQLSTGKIVILAVLGVLIVFVLWVMATYNSLVSLNENAKTAQADIEVQYQRRFDLIPNLVSTAEGVAGFEKSVIANLAEARTRYSGAVPGSGERIGAINQLDGAISRLLVIVENYPTLKSAESFLKLQDQLEGTENRISKARNDYNGAVNQLNKKVQYFPSNVIARWFGFDGRERFEASVGASVPPKVDINIQ